MVMVMVMVAVVVVVIVNIVGDYFELCWLGVLGFAVLR